MAKRNGGIIGPANTPTSSVAAGVWRLRDAFNSIKNGTWPLTKSVATNSLRFNSASSDYLSKSSFGTATNRKIFTFSLWVKRSTLSVNNGYLMSAGTNASTNIDEFYFHSTDALSFSGYESSTTQFELRATQLSRDVSAWYHVVVAYDSTQTTSSNRIKMYLNGSQITSFSISTYPTLNFEPLFNSATAHTIGANLASGGKYQDGYLSEFHFIDGQALTPSSFGASNSSGVWYPIAYQGTWGTNGFYLKFANSASLGTDSSGNNNTFTVNNLTSVDQSTDTELNNFATLNPLAIMSTISSIQTLSEGNLKAVSSAAWRYAYGSIPMSSGKWYVEVKITSISGSNYVTIGLNPDNFSNGSDTAHSYSTTGVWYNSNGEKWVASSNTAYGNSYTTNDIIGVAIDMTNSQVTFYKNGVAQNSGTPLNFNANLTGASSIIFGLDCFTATTEVNFGNPPYSANGYTDAAGYGNFSYAVPSGYYALCTKNLNTYG